MMLKRTICCTVCVCLIICALLARGIGETSLPGGLYTTTEDRTFIKWVDFHASYEAMSCALELDIQSYEQDVRISWIDLLAYAAAKNGGSFPSSAVSDVRSCAQALKDGKTMEELTQNLKYYDYYSEAYTAILGGFVGEYYTEMDCENGDRRIEKRYGLKAFLPIAYQYSFSHYDDFGASRSYGYNRAHQGNDLMAAVGTPVVCVETGIVEEMGWNRFGGWRIGIRSLDSKRYYYYAHLQKGHPFNNMLSIGQQVQGGEVIGYVGMTGYSSTEDVNGMNVPHLHFGLQLIFDESQKESETEIWIDVYHLVDLLRKNPSLVVKNEQTGEYEKKYKVYDSPGQR